MSHYKSQFDAAQEQLGGDLADVVLYAPADAGVQPFSMSIIVGPESLVERQERDGSKWVHLRECTIPANSRAAGGGPFLREPRIRDRFTYRETEYIVDRIIGRTESITRVEATRKAVREKTREGLRRQS